MSLESLNYQLFYAVNATNQPSVITTKFATFCANDLLYLTFIFLVVYWIKGNDEKRQLVLKAILATLLALIVAFVIGLIDPTARPFVAGIGHTWMVHAPTPSFPSDHMTIFSVLMTSFYLAKKQLLSLILAMTGLLTAWARVYVGIHFPLDMLGGLLLGVVSSQIVTIIWQKFGYLLPTTALARLPFVSVKSRH